MQGALQSKGCVYYHHSLGPHQSAVGEREHRTEVTNMGFGAVSLPPRVPGCAEKGGKEGKEVRRSSRPSLATLHDLAVSESLSLDFV